MSDHATAHAGAEAQVAAARDDPAVRLALMARVFHGPTGHAPRHFFMNVALARVPYAHALNAAPRLALGRLAPFGRLVVGHPRLGMAGVFLSLRRVLPNRYPLALDVDRYIAVRDSFGDAHIWASVRRVNFDPTRAAVVN